MFAEGHDHLVDDAGVGVGCDVGAVLAAQLHVADHQLRDHLTNRVAASSNIVTGKRTTQWFVYNDCKINLNIFNLLKPIIVQRILSSNHRN